MGFDYSEDGVLHEDARILVSAIYDFLLPVDIESFPSSEGTATYICSDGHQFRRMIQAHWQRCPECICDHTYADHGIPLCIAPGSPVAEWYLSSHWLNRLVGAFKMKADHLGESVVSYQHWPCGHAAGHNLPVIEQFKLLIAGKDAMAYAFTEANLPVPRRFVGFHIDHNPLIPIEQQGLYYFDRQAFNRYLARAEAAANDHPMSQAIEA